MSARYDPTEVLSGLKDFQRDTVEYVFERLYQDADQASRFLVADEVGLGKTLVARGLVAKAVRHLQEKRVRRIDVIYVCSNADIAAQNIQRLTLPGFSAFTRATRLTLLPLELHNLSRNRLNFVAFTPGTSFNLPSSMGTVRERALLHVLLRKAWGAKAVTTSGGYRILQGWVGQLETFKWHIHQVRTSELDRELVHRFAEALDEADRQAHRMGRPGLRDRFADLAVRFRYPRRHRPYEDRDDRAALVGELRQILASACLDALEPDLVILDEFQRFRNLLDGTDSASELARELFTYPKVRVLLLSATPYKMYSLADEPEEEHYRDFVRTARFLMHDQVEEFAANLAEFRRALYELADGGRQRAHTAKKAIEEQLRRVMVRTERLAVSTDRSGMLRERPSPALRIEARDLTSFIATTRIAAGLHAGGVVEYWKSAPYLLNFMDGYKLIREFERVDRRTRAWRDIKPILRAGTGLVPWEAYTAYQRIDPENARLRDLLSSTVETGAWRLLWTPPSMPYYTPGAPFNDKQLAAFTKRLVFSAWTVVPKVIASLVSYEAERNMMTGAGPAENSREARQRLKPLLQFKTSRGRLSGGSTFALVYPSPSLARLGDPLTLSLEMTGGDRPAPRTRLLAQAREQIEPEVRALTAHAPADGPEDKRWYWAAPLLLDHAVGLFTEWFNQEGLAGRWIGDGDEPDKVSPEDSAFADFLDYARALVGGEQRDPEGREIRPLGRVPRDLTRVLAEIAVASPGVTALRALARGPGGVALVEQPEIRNAAAAIAWAFRSLFNLPDVTTMIRSLYRTRPYWHRVLRYCGHGGLQAVLDEYVHVLRDWLGIIDDDPPSTADKLAAACREALSLRTVGYVARDVTRLGQDDADYRFRSRFALRFGTERSEDEKELERASSVRGAFNSPFWPFVLATTSIGQEGLDFHLYCHAVVHWNLPSNPVDLEQREGRVHRYKGHAVRKNLARVHRATAMAAGGDPWRAAFDEAARHRQAGENDMIPYWLYPVKNGATIDRYVPALPLSREVARLGDLKQALALYRLVFGQPRQEDLIAYLLSKGLAEDEIEELVEELRIDLTPKSG